MAMPRRAEEGRRVGELAAATGLTVRTLHYYDEIGLLVASGRSDGGHRLYAATDVERLYRICLLRRLGLPLAEIGRVLDDPAWSLRAAIARHLDEVERRLEATARLRGRLVEVLRSMEAGDGPVTEDLLDLLERMTMLDTTVQRRISYLVYADISSVYDYLVRVFGLGPGERTMLTMAGSFMRRSRPATVSSGSTRSPPSLGCPHRSQRGRRQAVRP
jgi:DNA-binding transcriptional MerR regulator